MQVRRLLLIKFVKNHTQRPNVNLLIIRLLSYQLWSHPSRSADNRASGLPFFGQESSKTKISNFDRTILMKEDVIAFKIPVNLLLRMQMNQSLEKLSQYIGNGWFWHLAITTDQVSERSCIHVIHKHKDRFFKIVSFNMLYDIVSLA